MWTILKVFIASVLCFDFLVLRHAPSHPWLSHRLPVQPWIRHFLILGLIFFNKD